MNEFTMHGPINVTSVRVCSSGLSNELADRLGETKLVMNVITLEVTQIPFFIISYNH